VPYVKLAKAFEAKDWDEVEKIAEDEKKGFEKVAKKLLASS
jgi:hypothetical protein